MLYKHHLTSFNYIMHFISNVLLSQEQNKIKNSVKKLNTHMERYSDAYGYGLFAFNAKLN